MTADSSGGRGRAQLFTHRVVDTVWVVEPGKDEDTMRMNLTMAAVCAATVVAVSTATAERPRCNWRTRDPGVNGRQENQQDRIAQGIRSGELTPHEAAVLETKEARLRHLERRLKSDGTLSTEDRAHLQHRLDELSRDIYSQKHDAQTVPPAK